MISRVSNKLKIVLLILAAVFELIAVGADQAVLHFDDQISREEFNYENNNSYLSELKLRNKFITKEWHSLRSSMEEALFQDKEKAPDFDSRINFYRFLVKFTTSTPDALFHVSDERLASEYNEVKLKLKALDSYQSVSSGLINVDEQLLTVNQFFNKTIATVSSRMSKIEKSISAQKLDRHFILILGVVAQISGLLFLLIFLIAEYPHKSAAA